MPALAKLIYLGTAAATGAGAVVVTGEPAALAKLLPPHAVHSAPLPAGKGCGTPVGKSVCARTGDPHLRSAMLLGALLEGGGLAGPWRCGDGGVSCGPWQIKLSVHRTVSRSEAQDPAFAAAYMLPAYTAGCRSVPLVTWRKDPRGAAALCAFRAERPARMYPASRVAAAWQRLGGSK